MYSNAENMTLFTKRNAILLSIEEGCTAAEVTENLEIAKDLLYRWRGEYRSNEGLAFPGHGKKP